MIKKNDFQFVGVKLVQNRGKSTIYYKERVMIKDENGDEEELWASKTYKPPRFPHDDLKVAVLALIPIFSKQTKRAEDELRVTYFGVEKTKEDEDYAIQGMIREPSGYYNSYNPHKLNEACQAYYDKDGELPVLADTIVKEVYAWLTNKKYDSSAITKLWDEEEEIEGMAIDLSDEDDGDESEEN